MADTSPDGGAEELAPVEDASVEDASAEDAPAEAAPAEAAPAGTVPAGTVKATVVVEQTAPTAPKPASPTGQARPGQAAPATEPRSGRRKVREGIVASNAMDKTAIVLVVERVRHARYAKTVQRTKRLYAHDEANDVKVGDRVRLTETRPMSKLKRWRVEQVLERAR
jgi:small subunit ribosomal protein S17